MSQLNSSTIAFSSQNCLAMRVRKANERDRISWLSFDKQNIKTRIVNADAFAISPSSTKLCVYSKSTIHCFDLESNNLLCSILVPENSVVYKLVWVGEDTLAGVFSNGVFIAPCSKGSSCTRIATLDPCISPEQVTGLFVSIEHKHYLLQMNDSEIGKIQFGRFYSEYKIIHGMAGCISPLDVSGIHTTICVVFRQSRQDPNQFYLCVVNLDNNSKFYFQSVGCVIDNVSADTRPEFVFVDSHTGLVSVHFRHGLIQVWDILCSCEVCEQCVESSPLICGCITDDSEFLGVWKDQPTVFKLSFDLNKLLDEYYRLSMQNELYVVYLYLRLNKPPSSNENLMILLLALVSTDSAFIESAIQPFLNDCSVSDREDVVQEICKDSGKRRFCEMLWELRMNDCSEWVKNVEEYLQMVEAEVKNRKKHFRSTADLYSQRMQAISTVLRLLPPSKSKAEVEDYLKSVLFENGNDRAASLYMSYRADCCVCIKQVIMLE